MVVLTYELEEASLRELPGIMSRLGHTGYYLRGIHMCAIGTTMRETTGPHPSRSPDAQGAVTATQIWRLACYRARANEKVDILDEVLQPRTGSFYEA